MRILASNAICYLFLVISQLATLTQGNFLRLGKGFNTAAGASQASEAGSSGARAIGFADQHSYWYPASTNAIDEEVAKQELRIFPPSPTSSSSTFSLKKITFWSRGKKQSSALREEDQRRQAFVEELRMVDDPVDYHINMIQLCFKTLLEKPNLNEEEAVKWLEVLKNTLHEQKSEPFAGSKAISTLYGLYSLRLRYLNDHHPLPLFAPPMNSPENLEFLRNIDEMIAQLKQTHFGVVGEGASNLDLDAAWEKEILNPSQGLSDELANEDSFMTFIKNDEELPMAMNDNISTKIAALKTLQQNFKSYSAHKRVAILAALYHQMASPIHELKQPIEFLKYLSGSQYLFPHERELLQWIRGRTKLRRGRQAS